MNDEHVPVSVSKLLEKCRCHEDIVNICRELRNLKIIYNLNIGFFPQGKRIRRNCFLHLGSGKKSKNINFILYTYSN